ncbi:hypothetical protein E0H75_41395 [Kribbella capetownensis]|uniref:Uncharacterized protein n=1 Tax=Kribbella capetownensis TaxID=1572659 RepID=A0A4R0J278_9ACTN|nr:hypothetical protein E0H75_41395 [Kribbella capetownensis]
MDSLALEIVRGVDQAADNIIGLTEGIAPGPAGTLSAKLVVGGIAAGAARTLTLWTSDLDRAAGASVRVRTEARRGCRVWSNPPDVGAAEPISVPSSLVRRDLRATLAPTAPAVRRATAPRAQGSLVPVKFCAARAVPGMA